MEAVAYVAGEPWTDQPQCASPVIAAFLRRYNDAVSDAVRQTLKPYVLKLVGSRGSKSVEEARAWMAMDWLARVHLPAWLRLAKLNADANALAGLPAITSPKRLKAAQPALAAARAAARDAAWAAANAAAWDAARDAAWAAANAAAWAAANAAARAAASAAAWDALRPTVEDLQAIVPALLDEMLAVGQ